MSAMKKPAQPEQTYLLMDEGSRFLARANLEGSANGTNMQMIITEGDVGDVVAAELINAIPVDDNLPLRMGRVILRRGTRVVLEPLGGLDESARRNLRMPVHFETLVYFEDGGRAKAKAVDLSCGGIAFYCEVKLKLHERFEIVIPITTASPSVLTAEILRVEPQADGQILYASKFVNLVREEEARVREAVFHVQLREGRVISAN